MTNEGLNNNQINQRFDYLDSIRGMACLSVVLYHFVGGFDASIQFLNKTQIQILSLFFNGPASVSFFFVLSGFVLSIKYFHGSLANKPVDYKRFVITRMYRLYPAFWVALSCYFLHFVWGNKFKVFNTLTELVNEASLIHNFTKLYNPGWTLNVELVISLFIPFIILLVRYDKRLFHILILLSLLLSAFFSSFLLHFLLGMLLAYHYPSLSSYSFRSNRFYPYRYLLVICIIIAYLAAPISDMIPLPEIYKWLRQFTGIDLFQVSGIGAFFILGIVINQQRLQRILNHRILTFLGKISYSMYLVHWFWLFNLIIPRFKSFQKLFGTNDFITALLIGVIMMTCTIVSACVLYYFVELPWIKKGKQRLAKLKTY
ncbi:MAG TPA: acyltransferase [Chitinophagaceae bacterium]|mgnify:CR=1 FL=1|nr:acyltransferase [Chitinophagaceae bacterium]